jgi:2-methylcitrate dehydratase PrpD
MKHLIAAHDLTADGIESVEVSYPSSHYKVIAITAPHDFLSMQFSTSYTLALTLLKGKNTPREYTMEALADPEIKAFAAKVTVRDDAELSKMAEVELCQPARVKVVTKSGEVHVATRSKGTAAKMSAAEVDEKFRSQVVAVLGAERCEQALQAIRNIAALDDMAELLPLLVVAGAKAKRRH